MIVQAFRVQAVDSNKQKNTFLLTLLYTGYILVKYLQAWCTGEVFQKLNAHIFTGIQRNKPASPI